MAEGTNISQGVNVSELAINASSGAFKPVNPTCTSYYVEIVEDGGQNAGVKQGIEYQLPVVIDGAVASWSATFTVAPADEPLKIGERHTHRAPGPIIGHVPQQVLGAPALGNVIPICQIRSAASASSVIVKEYQ